MLKNYFKIALRNIRRNKVYSLINVMGLAVGIACTIIISMWVADESNYDGFHKNADNIFHVFKTVYTPQREFWTRNTSAPLAAELKQDYSEIINTSRVGRTGDMVVRYQDKMFVEKRFAGVDPSYFEMFTIPFIIGDSLTALSQPHSVVITSSLASKYFGEQDAIGKVFQINNQFDCIVTAIIQDPPTNTLNRFDALVPITFLRELGLNLDNYDGDNFSTYIQIQDGVDYKSLSQRIFEQFSKPVIQPDTTEKLYLIPLTEVRFFHNMHQVVVYVFSILAAVILLIACINFINLSTAGATNRAKEVGIRKVAGASQTQLCWQFLSEGIWITMIALFVALLLVETFLPMFNYYAGKQLVMEYSDFQTYLTLAGIGLLTAVFAGGYPAFFLASFQPTAVLKKHLFQGTGGGLSRKILVVTQFSFAIVLIIAMIYLYQQVDFIQNSDPGFENENIVVTCLGGEIRHKLDEVRQELLQHPHIENVTAAYNLPNSNGYYTSVHAAVDLEKSSHIVWDIVDYDYLQTFKLKLKQGRFFSREYADDSNQAIVINELLAKALHLAEPVGQLVIMRDRHYTIIGVLEDFHNRPLVYPIEPMVLMLGTSEYGILFTKIAAQDKNTIAATLNDIKTVCNKFSPDYPLEYYYLKDFPLEGTDDLQAAGHVLLVFTVLGIGISCLGLYGLSLFLTEQRKKEVGIRKVLGCSVLGIINIFSREYVSLLLIANAIAWPVAYWIINQALLSTYKVEWSLWTFIVPGILVVLLALLTISLRILRAAIANPVESLRYE